MSPKLSEDSPSLDGALHENSTAPSPRGDQPTRRRSLRPLVIALAILAVALAGVSFFRSDVAATMMGTGSVAGVAVDDQNRPVQAEVFVLGASHSVQANASGEFLLSGVKAGSQKIIVAYQGTGSEVPVTVQPGQTTNIGPVKVVATQMPPQP